LHPTLFFKKSIYAATKYGGDVRKVQRMQTSSQLAGKNLTGLTRASSFGRRVWKIGFRAKTGVNYRHQNFYDRIEKVLFG
jgi:hypothetical protein